jgi:hypothetical protein
MHTEAAASAARAPKILLVRPAGGRFVRLELHLIALRLCCSTACELWTVFCSHDERSAVRSSQAAEQHSRSAIRCSPSLTKPGPAGRTGHDDWPVQASAAVLVVACLQPATAQKLPTDVYLTLS